MADSELVEDPVETDIEIRYGEQASPAPLATLATWTDQVIGEWLARQAATTAGQAR